MSAKAGKRLAVAKSVRFSCQSCADCCRNSPVSLTPAEVERYEARDWTELLGYPGPVHKLTTSGLTSVWHLKRKPNGECLFLRDDNLCAMHATFGAADKPLVCRVYPHTFVAGPSKPIVGASFTCSSVASGDGEPLVNRRSTLEAQLKEVTAFTSLGPGNEDRQFFGPTHYPRVDFEFLADLVRSEFEHQDATFPDRMLTVSSFLNLLGESNLSTLSKGSAKKQVTAFAHGARAQVERKLITVPTRSPSLPQRLLFRLILGFACRRDPVDLLTRGLFRRTVHRFGNLLAGMAYLAGTGALKPFDRDRRVVIGEVRRQAPSADPRTPVADGALTRYFVGELANHTLFNTQFKVRAFLPAMGLLLRQYPLILLFARAACHAREGTSLEREDYASALRTVAVNFGRVGWDRGLAGPLRGVLLSEPRAALELVPWCATRPADVAQAEAQSS